MMYTRVILIFLKSKEDTNMAIKATITIDDDRWAKHPYGVELDNPECDDRYGRAGLNRRADCNEIIEHARNAGYDIDFHVDERFY